MKLTLQIQLLPDNKQADQLKATYAIVGGEWKYGDRKTLTLKSVAATAQTQISVLFRRSSNTRC